MTTAKNPTSAVHECSPPPTSASSDRPIRGYASGKDDYLARLRKIEGQVRGLQRMIEDDRWCPHIVTQISSVTGALQEVAIGLLNDHIRHCVIDAARDSDSGGQDCLDEVASTIRQVLKL